MDSEEFKKLEEEYAFLSHARERLRAQATGLESGTYTVVDLETTGLDPVANEIIEIGAIKTENGEAKDIYNKLIIPDSAISAEITRITGITQEMVEGCPKIGSILDEFLKFIGDSTLIVHNADFDISFIKEALKKAKKDDLKNAVVCTLKTARALLPNLENHKLHTIAHYFNIPISARHRAIGDCEATLQVWLSMVKKLKDRGINNREQLEKFIRENTPVVTPF